MSEGVYGEQATGRVTHGLLRLSTAMRSQAWEWAEGAGLTPTQGEILVLLMQRKGPMRLGEIARETALTAATTSDAVSTLEGKGLPDELKEPMRGLMSEYQSRHHAQPGAANPNNALLDKYGLRDYLATLGTIAGPPEHCVERVREVAALGATNLVVAQFVSDQYEWMQTFTENVLPAFR